MTSFFIGRIKILGSRKQRNSTKLNKSLRKNTKNKEFEINDLILHNHFIFISDIDRITTINYHILFLINDLILHNHFVFFQILIT